MFQKTTLLILSLFLTSVSAYALTDQEREKLRVQTISSSNIQHYANPMIDGKRLDNLYNSGIPGPNSNNQAANKFCESKGHLGAFNISLDRTVVYPTKSIGNGGVCNWPIPCIGFSNISCVTSCKPGFVNTKNSNGAYECKDRRYYKVGSVDQSLSAEAPALEVGKTKCPTGWTLESNDKVVCSKNVEISVAAREVNAECPEGSRESDIFMNNVDGCKFTGNMYKKITCTTGTHTPSSGRDKCSIAASTTTEKRYVRVFPSSAHPNPIVGTTDRAANEQRCELGDSDMPNHPVVNGYAYCRKR